MNKNQIIIFNSYKNNIYRLLSEGQNLASSVPGVDLMQNGPSVICGEYLHK